MRASGSFASSYIGPVGQGGAGGVVQVELGEQGEAQGSGRAESNQEHEVYSMVLQQGPMDERRVA